MSGPSDARRSEQTFCFLENEGEYNALLETLLRDWLEAR